MKESTVNKLRDLKICEIREFRNREYRGFPVPQKQNLRYISVSNCYYVTTLGYSDLSYFELFLNFQKWTVITIL